LVSEALAFVRYNTPLVNQIEGDSYDVGMSWTRGPVDLVFVDGDHTFYGVERDIKAWLPRVKHGGFMLFHDYAHEQWSGVKPAVDALMAGHAQIMVVDLLAVYRIVWPVQIQESAPDEGFTPVHIPKERKPRKAKVKVAKEE
jgi:hypothetical protein